MSRVGGHRDGVSGTGPQGGGSLLKQAGLLSSDMCQVSCQVPDAPWGHPGWERRSQLSGSGLKTQWVWVGSHSGRRPRGAVGSVARGRTWGEVSQVGPVRMGPGWVSSGVRSRELLSPLVDRVVPRAPS